VSRAAGSPVVASRSRVPAAPRAVLLVLGGIISLQLGAALAKQLFPAVGPAGAVLMRLTVGAAILGVVARPTRAAVRGHLRLALAFGAVLAAMNLSFYASLTRIPLGPAVTIEFLGPLLLAGGMSRRLRDVGWAALAAGGVAALSWEGAGGGLDPLGIGLAAAAGTCWAGYILLSQRLGAAAPGLAGLCVAVAAAAVVAAVPGIAEGGSRLLEPRSLVLGAAVGVLSSAVPYALELMALRRVPAGTFGILMSLEPAVAALAGLLLLREGLRPVQVAGIVLVCLASAAVTAGRPPEP
jgi:inner membrane transporter RhtA